MPDCAAGMHRCADGIRLRGIGFHPSDVCGMRSDLCDSDLRSRGKDWRMRAGGIRRMNAILPRRMSSFLPYPVRFSALPPPFPLPRILRPPPASPDRAAAQLRGPGFVDEVREGVDGHTAVHDILCEEQMHRGHDQDEVEAVQYAFPDRYPAPGRGHRHERADIAEQDRDHDRHVPAQSPELRLTRRHLGAGLRRREHEVRRQRAKPVEQDREQDGYERAFFFRIGFFPCH